jgi:hypothetical protein
MFDSFYPMFGLTKLVQEHFLFMALLFKRLIHLKLGKRFGPIRVDHTIEISCCTVRQVLDTKIPTSLFSVRMRDRVASSKQLKICLLCMTNPVLLSWKQAYSRGLWFESSY